MKLTLTQKGYDIFQSYLKEMTESYNKNPIGDAPKIKDNFDFVYTHNEVDELDNVTTTYYQCCLGEEMTVDNDHYNNSATLKEFVKQEYLEII